MQASDLEPVLESMKYNIRNNKAPVNAIALDWNAPVIDLVVSDVDLLLASECLYEEEAVDALFKVLAAFKIPCLLTGIIGENVLKRFQILCKNYQCRVMDGDDSLAAKSQDEAWKCGARYIYLISPKD